MFLAVSFFSYGSERDLLLAQTKEYMFLLAEENYTRSRKFPKKINIKNYIKVKDSNFIMNC